MKIKLEILGENIANILQIDWTLFWYTEFADYLTIHHSSTGVSLVRCISGYDYKLGQ